MPSLWKWNGISPVTLQFDGATKPVNKFGKFIQVFNANNTINATISNANLLSPIITSDIETNCFSFYYYIHGEGVGEINLFLIPINNISNLQQIWTRFTSAGDIWHKYSIKISEQSFFLKFVIASGTGAIALDEFYAYPGECSETPLCDFESGLCGWTVAGNNPKYQFQLIQAKVNQWIKHDHSTETGLGHLMETSSGGITGDWTTLTSPSWSQLGTQCLSFWHHQKFIDTKLEVLDNANSKTEPEVIWSTNLTVIDSMWHRASVTVFASQSKHNLIIKATLTDASNNLLPTDIDDISIEPGQCPPAVNCDFNKDMCDWGHNTEMGQFWQHGIGRVERADIFINHNIYYPPVDRLSDSDGMFMFTDFTQLASGQISTMTMHSAYVPDTTGSCLQFYYQPFSFGDEDNVFEISLLDTLDSVTKTAFTYNYQTDPQSKTKDKYWAKQSINIMSTKWFKFAFTVSASNASTYMAIDDITYTAGVCGQTLGTTPIPTLPTVSPDHTLACDFEHSTVCNWNNWAAYKWTVTTAQKTPPVDYDKLMPKADHTWDDIYGHFAYVKHTDQYSSQANYAYLNITDDTTPGYKGPVCFSLWYYIRETTNAQLIISLYSKSGAVLDSVARQNDQGEEWHQLNWEVSEKSSDDVFEILGYVKHGVIAIDDITSLHEPCKQQDPKVYKCTFEDDQHNCSFAPVYNPDQLNLHWTIDQGQLTTNKTIDHTLKTYYGHFYGLDFYKLTYTDEDYKLISESFPATTGACVTFSYLMTDLDGEETLNFFIQKDGASYPLPLWSATGEAGPIWYSHRMTVNSTLKWQILFRLDSDDTKRGLVAIDDVIVELDKPCPPKGRCDFEQKDTCMWEKLPVNDQYMDMDEKLRLAAIPVNSKVSMNDLIYADFQWDVHSTDYTYDELYPLTDHTLNTTSGNYLLMKGQSDRTISDRAVIVSDHYDINSKNRSFCLKFFYHFKSHHILGQKSRFEVYQSESYNRITKIAEVLTDTTDWTEFKVTAKPNNSYASNMWFYIVGDVGYNIAIIAIDDISIDSGDCPTGITMFNCSKTESIPMSKVCDGVKDCSNGADEANCGSCAFNATNNWCSFTQKDTYQDNYRSYQWRIGNSTTGPNEGPVDSSGFIVAETYRYTDIFELAYLYSPKIIDSAAGCYISFEYNMFGHMLTSERLSHLTIEIDNQDFVTTQIWNSDAIAVEPSEWIKGQALIGRRNTKFSITYKAREDKLDEDYDSYVALANIKMVGCRQVMHTNCKDDSFYCSNGNCIDSDFECDYVDDCGDNSDEISCQAFKARCDFESGLCNWGHYSRGGWALHKGYNSLLDGPTRDHTKGTRTGQYLMLMSSATTDTDSTIGGPVLMSSTDCVMRLWVSMEGNTTLYAAYVKVIGENLNTGEVITWATYDSTDLSKQFGYIRKIIKLDGISSSYQVKVSIRGYLPKHGISPVVSYIAVDDISFSSECVLGQETTTPRPIVTTPNPCGQGSTHFYCKKSMKCIDAKLVCNFHNDCGSGDTSDEESCGTCTFDQCPTGDCMCGWVNIGKGKENWVRQDVGTHFGGTYFPKVDGAGKTTGSYLIIDTAKGGTAQLPARIITPLLGVAGPNCKMQFAFRHKYPVNVHPKLIVSLYKPRSMFHWEKQLLTITDITDWKSYSAHIGELSTAQTYQVIISAYADGVPLMDPYADVEIDEVKFVNCDAGAVITATLDCSFENGTCGWFDYGAQTDSQIDWVPTDSYLISPGHDHTSKQRPLPPQSGTWIYTERQSELVGNNTATLMSAEAQKPTQGPKCLTFWYHMFGRDPGNFSLIINYNQSPVGGQVLWIKRMPQSNNWVKAQVDIATQSKNYYLMFRASMIAKSELTIGLDDIAYTDGQCPEGQVCDFEADFCQWNEGSKKQYDFIREQAGGKGNEPQIDHTLSASDGHYIKVLTLNKLVQLLHTISGDQVGLNNYCLKFWYYFAGANDMSNYFNISSSRTKSIDTKYAKQISDNYLLKQWVYERYNMRLMVSDIVTINGQITMASSIVAFDDIQIASQSCEQPGWCDFETDFCGWSNAPPSLNKRQVVWTRNSGATESDNSGPEVDHTTGTEDGWYVYVPLDAQSDGIAILQSELLTPYTTVCFGFYYNIYAENYVMGTKLIIYYVPALGNPIFLASISSNYDQDWNGFNVTLHNLQTGRFVLKTVLGQKSRADVAIDDISIQQGACDSTGSTTTQTVTMTTPEPIVDEQWDCDFEATSCNWTTPGAHTWSRTSWNSGAGKVGPRVDHTLKSIYGHYLFYDGSTLSAPNPVIITSTVLTTLAEQPICLSIWYYVDSESKFNLTLGYYSGTDPDSYTDLYDLANTIVTRTWKQVELNLWAEYESKLSIQLQHSHTFIGGVAIDDIKVSQGVCKKDDGVQCDFSNDYCDYQLVRQSTHSIDMGYRTTGLTTQFGPNVDHTTQESSGFYFMFGKTTPEDPNDLYQTNMIINKLPEAEFKPRCLKFWYQINTKSTTDFYIYVATQDSQTYSNPKWQPIASNLTKWTNGQVAIYAPYEHKIVFSLVRPKTALDSSYIALDDISLKEGPCEPPVTCDFDTDMCSWSNLKSVQANWNWGRFTGPPSIYDTWHGPRYDHTYQRAGGSYLYLAEPNTYLKTRIAIIESMPVQLIEIKCLSFWTQLIGTDTSIEASIMKINAKPQTLLQISGTKSVWTKVGVNIRPEYLKDSNVFTVRIKGVFQNWNSFIALDDLQLTEGKCDESEEVFFCNNGTQLDISKVCNFVYDCMDHTDEQNCSVCDFEIDQCGWSNKNTVGEQWARKVANNQILGGPKVDGKHNSLGHYMIVVPNPKQFSRAILTSTTSVRNKLKWGFRTCKMTFDYYMTVKNNSESESERAVIFMVNIRSSVSSYTTVWRMDGNQGQQWNKGIVSIDEQDTPFEIEITGAYPGEASVLAVDDIAFVSCAPPMPSSYSCDSTQVKCPNTKVCINRHFICDGVNDCGDNWDENAVNCQNLTVPKCQFENVYNVFECKLTEEYDLDTNSKWYIDDANIVSVDTYLRRMTGPANDHTYRLANKGSFAVLKADVGTKDYGKKVRLITPMVKAVSGHTCALRLFYYMFGDQSMGVLKIFVRYADPDIKSSVVPFIQTGNAGQQWLRAVLENKDQRDFQFVIEGQIGTGVKADIAIDDISYSDGCIASKVLPSTTTPRPTTTTQAITTTTARVITHRQFTSPKSHSTDIMTKSTMAVLPTTTKSILVHHSDKGHNSNGGKIAIGILLPVCLIAIIIGILYYRRYRQRLNSEDRVAFSNHAFDANVSFMESSH